MSTWNRRDVDALTSPQEVQVVTRRGDGTLRRPRTIWIVGDGDRVFIRSTNGRGADWFRRALAAGAGQIRSRGTAYDVRFTEVGDEADLAAADAGYRAKYGHYAPIVDHLEEAGPRSATLEVHPACPPPERLLPMRGTIIHAPGDIRLEERPDPTVVEPTDAVLRRRRRVPGGRSCSGSHHDRDRARTPRW